MMKRGRWFEKLGIGEVSSVGLYFIWVSMKI